MKKWNVSSKVIKLLESAGVVFAEQEKPMDTIEEDWGDEEPIKKRGKGREFSKTPRDIIKKGVAMNNVSALVPRELREVIRVQAEDRGIPVSDYIASCLKAYVSNQKPFLEPILVSPPPLTPIVDHSTDQSDLYMTAQEASNALGICRPTLLKWAREGIIPCIKAGKYFTFKKKDVKSLLRSRMKK